MWNLECLQSGFRLVPPVAKSRWRAVACFELKARGSKGKTSRHLFATRCPRALLVTTGWVLSKNPCYSTRALYNVQRTTVCS